MTEGSRTTAGTCWFCGKGRGCGESVAYPFDAQSGDDVRVVVVSRCDACARVHRTQMLPSGVILVAAVMVPPLLITLLAPVSDGIRTALNAVGMVAGLGAGIVLVSQRERRTAARHHTRPSYDSREHEGYKTLAADTALWRPRPGPGMNPSSSTVTFRLETADDYRQHFRDDAKALAALEAGCREAGITPTP
ncbi:MAG TPA: hypothetical protein PLD86_04950 [Vicinamibacteria bacterium]|nr:hypothetical protein [Vicinamibacteria bacterium]